MIHYKRLSIVKILKIILSFHSFFLTSWCWDRINQKLVWGIWLHDAVCKKKVFFDKISRKEHLKRKIYMKLWKPWLFFLFLAKYETREGGGGGVEELRTKCRISMCQTEVPSIDEEALSYSWMTWEKLIGHLKIYDYVMLIWFYVIRMSPTPLFSGFPFWCRDLAQCGLWFSPTLLYTCIHTDLIPNSRFNSMRLCM